MRQHEIDKLGARGHRLTAQLTCNRRRDGRRDRACDPFRVRMGYFRRKTRLLYDLRQIIGEISPQRRDPHRGAIAE